MEILVWALIGGAVGWSAFSHLGYNGERGLMVSVALGAFGGLVGAMVLAPVLLAAPGLTLFGALFAAGTAAALLFVGDLVYGRWGV